MGRDVSQLCTQSKYIETRKKSKMKTNRENKTKIGDGVPLGRDVSQLHRVRMLKNRFISFALFLPEENEAVTIKKA